MPYKILFVCLGNICRSPSAENIMNHLIETAGLNWQIICDSAGTSNYHVGSPPDRRMTTALINRGFAVKGHARQFEYSDFEEFDLILAMDKENYHNILSLDRKKIYGDKVKFMCDFTQNYSTKEVPDPYYGGQKGFENVIDLLVDSCEGLLIHVKNQLKIA